MSNPYSKPDHWTLKAKKEGYPARSVYKLQEIDEKLKLVRKDSRVLDIGAAPGSWSLYVARKLAGSGSVTAIDLAAWQIAPKHPDLLFIQGDVFEAVNFERIAARGPFDLVLSDAAPATTGRSTVDAAASFSLVESILELLPRLLTPGGGFVAKIFQGGDEKILMDRMRLNFKEVRAIKPEASRKISFEVFFAGTGYRPARA